VIVMLALAVLVGLAVVVLSERLQTARPRPVLVRALAAAIGLAILVDYLTIPLPVLSTRIPRVLQAMGGEAGPRGSLLDVPLDWRVARYEYYQTAHGKPLLVGLLPRPAPAVVRQLEGVPFVAFFEEPGRHPSPLPESWDRRAALRLIDLFDLDAIVVHGEYLDAAAVDRVRTVVQRHFPVTTVVDDDRLTVVRLGRDHDRVAVWTPDAYDFEFGPGRPRFFVAKGWWPAETSGTTGLAWSMGRESTLGFYLPRAGALTMALELSPLPVPDGPPQRVTVTFNGRAIGRVELQRQWGWRAYPVRVPADATRAGINVVRFTYEYTAIPRDVIPGNRDPRPLAVAFHRIQVRPE
ncbi:MAG TPA: hypothetical protein VGJ70_24870, partial [Solirubrobacteraceae bacterium]